MSEFGNMMMRLDLRMLAASTLIQQLHNERRLEQDQNTDRPDLPAVSLPRGGVAKTDDAARRQVRLPEVPSPELPHIELRGAHLDRSNPQVRGALASENSYSDTYNCTSLLFAGDEASADNSLAEIRVNKAEHRRIRSGMQLRQRPVLVRRNAHHLRGQQDVEDRGLRWKR